MSPAPPPTQENEMTTEQKTDLDALIERVRGATGPCLDLDTDIHLAIVLKGWVRHPHAKPGTWLYRELWPSAEAHAAWAMDSNSEAPTEIAPKYTASLDAATALAERVFGSTAIDIEIGHRRVGGKLYGRAEICGPNVDSEMQHAATPALAIVLATLTAIKAQEGRRG
jgi:hypothetical protein